jgi:Protein of unknown function (DUF1838)
MQTHFQFSKWLNIVAVTGLIAFAGASYALDLSTYEGSMAAYQKMRADSKGADTFTDWQVTVYAVEPGKKAVAIMRLDGFNVGRFAKQPDGGFQWMSREVAYYRDLKTGKILNEWDNPITGQKNQVLQVINDPVNSKFAAAAAPGQSMLPWNVRGDDVFLKMDIPLAYPNALQPTDYPEEKLTSIPLTYAWTRTGPWLPWMKMGTRPGYVLYSGQGKKLKSADELDPMVRETTMKLHPDFMAAPKTFTTPNETSWTYYKKQFPKTNAATPASEKPK